MKEGEFFQSAKTEVEQKKKATSTKPLTLAEHEDTTAKPMDIKDHWLSLRQSIQDKISIAAEPESQDEKERTKLISELITPELLNEYKEILKDFRAKSGKSAEHPDREFIEVDEGGICRVD